MTYMSAGVRYRIRYSTHTKSFTTERKLPLCRLHHACAEESQCHVPWIPAPSFCSILHIVYDIAVIQCHSLRSGSSPCAGSITPAPKSLSATCPGFLHPLFAQIYSLLHRYLTRRGPSIAPHPHVDFEQQASSPAVWS
jgi:hypothetical protein